MDTMLDKKCQEMPLSTDGFYIDEHDIAQNQMSLTYVWINFVTITLPNLPMAMFVCIGLCILPFKQEMQEMETET